MEGLEAMKFYLDHRSDKNPSTATILRLTELVLKLNSFIFDDQHYLQIKGVAMGPMLGPGFACVYVDYFEERLFQSNNGPLPRLFKRYIDDIIGVMIGTRDNLDTFLQFVSSFSPSLTFTWSISETSVNFLTSPFLLTLAAYPRPSITKRLIHTAIFSTPRVTHLM